MMIGNHLNKDFILKSSAMASTNFIQFASISIILVAISNHSGHEQAAAYGGVLSLYSLLLMLPIGLMIWQISSFIPALIAFRKSQGEIKEKKLSEVFLLNRTFKKYNIFVSLGMLSIWILISILTLGFDLLPSYGVLLSILPGIIVSPFGYYYQGKLQTAQHEKEILKGALVAALFNIILVYAYLIFFKTDSIHVDLTFIGASQSLSGILLVLFLAKKARTLSSEFLEMGNSKISNKIDLSILVKIISGSVDGIILSAIFSISIIIASHNSPLDGFIISLVVSIMRMIVIPSKQFGLVGGRMHATGQLDSIATIIVSSFLSISTIALLVLPAYLSVSSTQIPVFILLLMLIQIALEPASGVMYGFIKVRYGPTKGIFSLIFSYIFMGLPLLLTSYMMNFSSAEFIWGILFSIRIIFTLLVIRSVIVLKAGS